METLWSTIEQDGIHNQHVFSEKDFTGLLVLQKFNMNIE